MNYITALLLALVAATAYANVQTVDNFVLLDHRGQAHELYYQSDAKAVVIIAHGSDCDAVQAQASDYQALQTDYAVQGVRILMINSNADEGRDQIAASARKFGLDIPILHDSAQIIGQSLEIGGTAEVIVLDPRNWQIVYRGPLSNQHGQPIVRFTLDQLVAGEQPGYSREVVKQSCAINYSESDPLVSYSKDIAPILQDNCMACHIEGGIGPWAMSEYRMVQGFAPMMREAIRTKRMPPWHADPEVGEWHNAAAMSDEETRILINWIESGAPRGEGPDPLATFEPLSTEWPLGEPDLILEIPAFEVPASGVVDYQFPVVANPLDYEAWIVAATVLPGDTKVVHHVLVGSADEAPGSDEPEESIFENYIMGYAPGNESSFMPEGTGVRVPVGGVYQFQMHYTPVGKASTDNTRVGLYFAGEGDIPANFLRQHVVLNPALKIPPQSEAHEEAAYFEFWDDAIIHSLVPHSHYRGRSSTFALIYPNGDTELVLSVPNYDFNWQRTYQFTEPKKVPRGTRIVHRTVYDNSPKNPGNPDPDREVPWGLQSHDEMLYGSVSYSWAHERSDAPLHSKLSEDAAQWMGFLDSDMDGKVQKDEMPEKLRASIGWKWIFLDRNFDGGLNLAEMERLLLRLREG